MSERFSWSRAGGSRLVALAAILSALAVTACALSGTLFTVPAAKAAAPLIGQWPLDSSHLSGGAEYTDDISGNGLALSSGPGTMHFGTEGGKFGGYLSGANGTSLEVTSPLLAPPQLTLLAWVKQNGDPGTLRYIAGRGDDGGFCGGSSYALYTGYPGLPGLHFYVRQPGPSAVPVVSDAPATASVFDNNWHLVAGTYDGANIRLYVDGVQVGPAKPASGISYEAPITDPPFYVDGYPPSSGCPDNSDFPGDIDETRVYNRALSQPELARLAAAPGPEAPALVPDAGAGGAPSGPSTAISAGLRPLGGSLLPSRGGFAGVELKTTGPVTETRVKIDGNTAFKVDPNASFIGFRFDDPGTHKITTTTLGVGGSAVTNSTPLTVKPTSLAKPKFFSEIAVAGPSVSSLLETLKNAACTPDTTVFFGVVEAQGCFRRLEDPESEMPKEEAAIANKYLVENWFTETLSGQKICQLEDRTCLRAMSTGLFGPDPALKPFVSPGKMKVNGMTIEPIGSASLVVFPAINRVLSKNARITYDGSVFGSIPVRSGELNLDLVTGRKIFTSGDEELPLFEFDTSQAFDDIGGFPINGKVNVVFQKKGDNRRTALKVNLSLPKEISTAAGADPTANVEVNADNQRGTYLNFLNIHIGQAFLGPVELSNVDFTYNDEGNAEQGCPRKWWKATAEVFFIPVDSDEQGAGLKMAPEPQRNGVAFCAGNFHSAGATLHFHYPELPPPEIFPGVTLNEIGFDFQLQQPVLFDGFATIKSAELVSVTGGFLAAFATPTHPYTFKPGDGGGSLGLLRGKTFSSTTIAVGGRVMIKPSDSVELELGSAYFLYSYPDFISAEGSAHLQTFLFAINARGSFELSTATRKFNALVEGEVCLAGGVKVAHVGACLGGEARVSSRGLSVCFNVGDGAWTPGVGYLYGEAVPEFFLGTLGDGCKPSHFWEKDVRAARISAAPGGPLVFKVKKGETTKNIELTGAGGAPAVTVVAPNGEKLASEPNLMLHGKRLSTLSADKFGRTWIGVENAKPGVYKIIPQPGSVPISNLMETHYEPEAEVKASVTGKGRSLVLHYDAGHAKDQSVSFFERGKGTWDLLKTVKGGKGQVAFHPSFGPAGKRAIAAQVEVDGIPAPLETLDHFKAPPPPKAIRVQKVRVVRHGAKLAVTWQKAPYATGYSVVTEASGGTVHSQHLKATRSSTTVKVPATEAGQVEVVAFSPLGERGKPGKAKFEALRKPTTRLLPFKPGASVGGETGNGGKKKGAGSRGGKGKKGGKS